MLTRLANGLSRLKVDVVSLAHPTPQLYNPTNFDVDAKGRMWVTEAVNYRNYRNEDFGISKPKGDRVVVLADADGDGKADSSHTFDQDPDLVAPLGIGVVDNQVIVSCSPNVLICTDVNRDAKFDPAVDRKEVFLTGFRGLDHDHSIAKDNIEGMKSSNLSMMPELKAQLTAQEVASLLEFLSKMKLN